MGYLRTVQLWECDFCGKELEADKGGWSKDIFYLNKKAGPDSLKIFPCDLCLCKNCYQAFTVQLEVLVNKKKTSV